MVWHNLSSAECDYSEKILKEMAGAAWISPLIRAIDEQGGIGNLQNRPLLFEARVCYELFRKNVVPQYEHSAGVGNSTIDLLIPGPNNWLIEIVAMDESAALEQATSKQELFDADGTSTGSIARFLELTGDAKDQRLTEAGEMIQLQQKLYEKIWKNGQPHKFPEIKPSFLQAIWIDARGFGGGHGPDADQRMQIVYGPNQVKNQQFVQFFAGKEVAGIFDEMNLRAAAKLMRERIHMIGFCCEKDFMPGGIQQSTVWYPNQFIPGWRELFAEFPDCLKRSSQS